MLKIFLWRKDNILMVSVKLLFYWFLFMAPKRNLTPEKETPNKKPHNLVNMNHQVDPNATTLATNAQVPTLSTSMAPNGTPNLENNLAQIPVIANHLGLIQNTLLTLSKKDSRPFSCHRK